MDKTRDRGYPAWGLRGNGMDRKDWPNLVSMFFDRATEKGDKPFLWRKQDGVWQATSWAGAAAQAAALARALGALGIRAGDRVALVSESRPEWAIADLAIMAAGGITVPAYTTNGVRDHLHVLTDSRAAGVIVSTAALAWKVLPAALEAPGVRFVITIDDLGAQQSPGMEIHRWAALLAEHDGAPDDVIAGAERLPRDATACLIYTSGTGGVPKGVMLSHGAILCNTRGAERVLMELGLRDEVFLSFLPLSHSYEHTAGQFFPIRIGAQIYYAEGIDRLSANMTEVKPTIMTAVPRLYEVMHDRIRRGVRQAGGRREKLFDRTVELGRKRYENRGRLKLSERLLDIVLTLLVRRKVRAGFGGRLKALVSGGAPLNYDIGLFFTALGVRLLQGYGQTESAPVVSCNTPVHNRIDTVGPPMEDVEIRIAEDGEILVRGELVMQGYWENPEATAETVRDGWLHTGDIGELDTDGHLRITDRKKDIIVNSGGDNVSPQRVEGMLTIEPEIAQAMVFGDRHPHLVGLVVPDAEWLTQWAASNNKPAALNEVAGDADLQKALMAVVERVNAGLSAIEKVRRITVADQPFTTENGLMTPTLKIRRHKIKEEYGQRLEALYR